MARASSAGRRVPSASDADSLFVRRYTFIVIRYSPSPIRRTPSAIGQRWFPIATRRIARSMLSRSAPCACVSGPARQGRDRRGRARRTGVRATGSGGRTTLEAERRQIELFDEEVDDTDQVILADPVLETIREKRDLFPVGAINETCHPCLPLPCQSLPRKSVSTQPRPRPACAARAETALAVGARA